MGMTAHLQFQKTLPFVRDANEGVLLFETKAAVPFAWYLLFTTDDLQTVGDGEVLIAPAAKARAHARTMTKALHPVLSDRLLKLLGHFVDSVAAAGDGFLIVEPFELDSSEQLTAPLDWLASFKTADLEEWFEEGAELFGDDPDGLAFEQDDEAGEPELDFVTKVRVAGWPIDAQHVEWIESDDDEEEEEDDQ